MLTLAVRYSLSKLETISAFVVLYLYAMSIVGDAIIITTIVERIFG